MRVERGTDIVWAGAKQAQSRLWLARAVTSAAVAIGGMAAAWLCALLLGSLNLAGWWGIGAWLLLAAGLVVAFRSWQALRIPRPAGALLASGRDIAAQERFLTGMKLAPVAGVSDELTQLAHRHFTSAGFTLTLPLQFKHLLNQIVPASIFLLTLAVVVSLALPPLIPGAVNALLLHTEQEIPIFYAIEVIPGDAEVLQGGELEVVVRITPNLAPGQVPRLVWGEESLSHGAPMLRSEDHFTATIPSITQPLKYQVKIATRESPEFKVEVLAKPLIKSRVLSVQLPGYLGGGRLTYPEGQADIAAPRGSIVTISVATIPPALSASIQLDNAKASEFPMSTESGLWQGSINLDGETAYRIVWSADGKLYAEDEFHHLSIEQDAPPIVWAVEPGHDVVINSEQVIRLAGAARDDHQVQSLGLILLHPLTGEAVRITLAGGSSQITGSYDWDVAQADLLPGEYLEYYFEAYDNDTVSGPKRAITQTYRIRMPELNEIVENATREVQTQAVSMEQLKAKSEELQKQLDAASKMSREATSPQAQNAGTREAKELAAQQQQLMQQLDKTTTAMKKNLGKMSENQYLSPELAEKLAEVRRLTQELMSPEMKDTLDKLRKQLESLDPEKVQQALEQMKNFSEQISQDLDRTLELLKQVQIEQKLEELVRRAQQAAVEQGELKRESEALKQPDSKLAGEQRDLGKDLEKLLQDVGDTSQDLAKDDQNTSDMLNRSQENARQNQIPEHMSQSALGMEAGQQQQASAESSEAQQGMEQFANELASAAEARRMAQRNQTLNTLNQALQELLSASSEQSSIAQNPDSEDTSGEDAISKGLDKTAAKLAEAAKKSFMVNPGMAKTAREISRDAQTVGKGAGSTQGEGRGLSPESLLARINGLAMAVLDSKASVLGSRSATGYSEMLEGLKQLAGQQEKLGQQMGAQGQPMPDLFGMAAQQMGIRQGMEQLAQRYQSMEEATGNLGDIAAQMKDLEQQMRSGGDAAKIRAQQQAIYEKLMQTERSIRTKGLSKRRKAEAAKFYPSAAPAGLPSGIESPQRYTGELPGEAETMPASYLEWVKGYYQKLRSK